MVDLETLQALYENVSPHRDTPPRASLTVHIGFIYLVSLDLIRVVGVAKDGGLFTAQVGYTSDRFHDVCTMFPRQRDPFQRVIL